MSRMLLLVVMVLTVSVAVIGVIRHASSSRRAATEPAGEVRSPSEAQQRPRDIFDLERAKEAPATGVEARLGTDDGFVAAIFYGGDTLGNLEVCG